MLQGRVHTRSSPQRNKPMNIMHQSYSDTLHPHISDVIANQQDGYQPSFMKNFFVLWLYKLVIYPSEFILNRTFIDQNVFPFFVVVSFYSSTPVSVQMLLDQKRYTEQNLRAIIHTARQTDNPTIYPLRKLVEYLSQLLIFVCLFKSALTLLPRLFQCSPTSHSQTHWSPTSGSREAGIDAPTATTAEVAFLELSLFLKFSFHLH